MSYDYIVIGAGSAGCVVAARLSEQQNLQVLLIDYAVYHQCEYQQSLYHDR